MPQVMVLADHIASQIAAGEVVERPSSVVKELVENSLDSGANQIEISVSTDCRDIRIADNGCGMSAEDAVLAFHRHATSKLRNVEDLWNLNSLGFRGEALPSIASVSRVTCYTRATDAAEGTKVECADGKVISTATGCAPGTAMEVHELFYNVPARLNFLKRASTEFGHIEEIVQSLAVAYPNVSFTLLHQDKTAFRTTGSGDRAQAVKEAGLFTGRETLCAVKAEHADIGLSIEGFVSRPVHFRGDRKGILCIVNSRTVRCPLIFKALDYAYSDLIPRGRHPLAVISIQVNPNQLDVNIHPTKKEIKYSNGNQVYLAIQGALLNALRPLRLEVVAEDSAAAEESIGTASGGGVEPAEFAGVVAENSTLEQRSQRSKQLGFRDQLSYDVTSQYVRSGSSPNEVNHAGRARNLDADGTSALHAGGVRNLDADGTSALHARGVDGTDSLLKGNDGTAWLDGADGTSALHARGVDGTDSLLTGNDGMAWLDGLDGTLGPGRVDGSAAGSAYDFAPPHEQPSALYRPHPVGTESSMAPFTEAQTPDRPWQSEIRDYSLSGSDELRSDADPHKSTATSSKYRLPDGWRIAGYIHNTYIVVETPEGMEFLEQHILHERTLYERLLAKQTISGRTTEYGQRLLICQPLHLSPEQSSTLIDHMMLLERLGFEFDVQGNSITCTQVPLELAHRDYATAIQCMIEQLATASGTELELEATKSIACQSAIKNGMPLGHSDLIQLICEWWATPRNDTCPHGRPVRLPFSMAKLFDLFHPA